MTSIAKTDIDIDLAYRTQLLEKLKHTPASIITDKETKKHNTGVYFTDIPVNPFTQSANIDYKQAEDRGYFKLDFLNVSLYKQIKSEEHLNQLLEKEPVWELLGHEDFVKELFHVGDHSQILKQLKPQNIEQLAAVLAIIRPAKRHLLNKTWTEIMNEVWQKPSDGAYYFKKAHAIAYAHAILVQMNLIVEQAVS